MSNLYEDYKNYESILGNAHRVAESSNLPGQTNGPQDALRHMLGSAEATIRYGAENAERASNINETIDSVYDSKEATEMDRHNDKIGRELGEKHGNMHDVLDEALDMIGAEKSENGPKWITPSDPSNTSEDWKNNAKKEAQKTYPPKETRDSDRGRDLPHDSGTSTVVDDDDLQRAERMKNVARTTPDGPEMDILIKEMFMRKLLEYLSSLDRTLLDQIDEATDPNLPIEERQAKLFRLIREQQLEIIPFEFEDDNNPESRRKIIEEIRKYYIGNIFEALGIQGGWTDPPKNLRDEDVIRRQLERNSGNGGGNFTPGGP